MGWWVLERGNQHEFYQKRVVECCRYTVDNPKIGGLFLCTHNASLAISIIGRCGCTMFFLIMVKSKWPRA